MHTSAIGKGWSNLGLFWGRCDALVWWKAKGYKSEGRTHEAAKNAQIRARNPDSCGWALPSCFVWSATANALFLSVTWSRESAKRLTELASTLQVRSAAPGACALLALAFKVGWRKRAWAKLYSLAEQLNVAHLDSVLTNNFRNSGIAVGRFNYCCTVSEETKCAQSRSTSTGIR